MQEPPDEFAISTIEDLDPEPESKGRSMQARELVLGMLLLLGVLAWSGWQWWDQDQKQQNYRLGQDAAREHRWEEARSRYAAASGYRDADKQLAEAEELIGKRNEEYDLALSAEKEGRWADCYRAVQAVNVIEPGYKESRRIGTEAQRHIYDAGLRDTIVQREGEQGRGLYYRLGDSWHYLADSDQWSTVPGAGSRGRIVYDVAASSRILLEPRQTRRGKLVSPRMDSRSLVAAFIEGDNIRFEDLQLDPAEFEFFIWGDKGVWGLRPSDVWAGLPVGVRGSLFLSYNMAYQAFGSPNVTVLPQQSVSLIVLDLSPRGDRVLLADTSGYSPANPIVQIYAADGDGSNRHLLFTYNGGLRDARFAPDGEHVLVTTYYPAESDYRPEEQTVVLVGAQDGVPAKTLARGSASNTFTPALSATFLRKGQSTGMVVLIDWKEQPPRLSLTDPARPEEPVLYVDLGDSSPLRNQMWLTEMAQGDGIAVAWQDREDNMQIRIIKWGTPPQVSASSLWLPDREHFIGLMITEQHLLYGAIGQEIAPAGNGNARPIILRSRVLSDINAPGTPDGLDVGATIPDGNPFTQLWTWALGPDMLAYTMGGKLHLRPYEGQPDVETEERVTGLYNPLPYEFVRGLR
ncbi:MAG TPA: hypothetical protein VGE45_02225 [Chloroflexia bacterium]|jgi:hypothetical protein